MIIDKEMGNAGCIFIIFFYLFNKVHAKSIQSGQDGMVQQELYNILLQDNDDLKVNMDIGEDDYEMIGRSKSVRIKDEDKIFLEFNMIASKEYERLMEMNRADARVTNEKALKNMIMKKIGSRNLSQHFRLNQTRNRSATNEKVEYYYLVSDYYADAVNDTTAECYDPIELSPSDFELLDSLKLITAWNISHKCTKQESKGIGIEAIKCLLAEFYTKQQDFKTLAKNLWKVAAIWLAMYLVIAIPFWCTRGWCSCCLCCKFFKPQQTIQEAKNYLLLNPPGILVTKRGGIIQYEPTEREKDCYEEFGHFLKTL